MMENDIFNIPMDMTGRNPMVEDGISSLTTSNSLGQSRTCHLNNQNQTMSGYSLLSALEADTLASRSMPIGRNTLRDASLVSSNSNFNTEFQEQFSGGTPISATTLATLLSTRSGLHEDLNDIAILPSSVFPTKVLGTYVPNSTTHIPNSSLAATANCGYDGVNCDTNNKWDFDKFFVPPELGGKPSERAKF